MGLSRKAPWRIVSLDGSPLWIAWDSDKVFEDLIQAESLPAQTTKDRQSMEWRRNMSLRAERLDAGTWLMGPLAWNKKVGLPSRLSQTTERLSVKPQTIILRPWNLTKLALLVFKTCLGPITQFSLPISPLGTRMSILSLGTEFWEQITYSPVSQVNKWKRILSRDASCPKSRLQWFRWYNRGELEGTVEWYGLNYAPPQYVEVLPSSTWKWGLFGNRVVADIIS